MINVKAHYLFNESLRSFLGCGDDEDSSHERRPKFVDLNPIKRVDADLFYIYIYIYIYKLWYAVTPQV